MVSDTIIVSLAVTRMPVVQVLEKLLPEKQLFYQMVSDRLIVVGSRKKLEKENSSVLKTNFNGIIIDPKGNGIPFASIGLFEAGLVWSGSISSETGNYQLSHGFVPQHKYLLKVSSVGYKPLEVSFIYPDTSVAKRIMLTEEQNTLKTVSIISNRPMIERKTDRYIVNVEDSMLANGFNGLEVLQKSPGIWVDNDGSIKIRGNQSVMVMINDVVQRMSGSDLAEYLRTLRSEDISKIEIISSPPSEFEAAGSGGIIHIRLKKSRRDGLVGSLTTSYRQQEKRPDYGSSISLNYKIKKLYLSGNLSAGREKSDFFASTKTRYPNQDYYSSTTDRYNNNGRLMYRIAAAYDLNANQSIGIQSVQTVNKMNQYFDTGISYIGNQPLTGFARSEWFRKPLLNNTTLNYSLNTDSLGSGIKIIADYVHSTKAEVNDFSSSYTLPQKNSTYRNSTPNTTNLYSVQTDYTKIFGKEVSFKAGLKFVATERDNEVLNENYIGGNWVLNTNLSNRFIYKEYLSMAYTSFEKSWGKLSIKAGLRAEQTNMDGNSITGNEQFKRAYLRLFPSVFISKKLNEEKGSSVFLSYSRRLQRPSFADLNPYRVQFDEYLAKIGNPDLMPEYTHNMEIGTVFRNGTTLEIYYSLTKDKIAELASPGAGNIIEYQTRNFNSSNEYGFSLEAPIKILKWWTSNTSLAGYNLRYTINDYQIHQTTFYIRSQHTILIKNLFDFDVSTGYRSPFVRANTNVAYQFSTNMGNLKKTLQ